MKKIGMARALAFSVMYLCVLFVVGMVWLFFLNKPVSTTTYFIYQLSCVPCILVLAKWYFKKNQPSFKKGVSLGICATIFLNIFVILMALLSIRTSVSGHGLDVLPLVLGDIYTEWRIYLTMIVLLVTTAYAGFEFDQTYTFDDKGLHKKSK